MKIININDLLGLSLTVDSTAYTCDNTNITADATVVEGGEIAFKIIPRNYVSEVKLKWYNELKETTYIETCFTRTEKGYLVVPYIYRDIVEGDSFEITITDMSDNLLIRFKAYATMTNDLQNYKLNVPNNNGVIKI